MSLRCPEGLSPNAPNAWAGMISPPSLSRSIHHIGFAVPDLRAAILSWVGAFGAGPFYVNEHVTYDECTSNGTSAAWDHAAGFGQCGILPVELQQTREVRPPALARRVSAQGHAVLNHVGVTVEDPAAESARLEASGFEVCMHARLGEIEFFWHDAIETHGYGIEVITAAPALDTFFATIADGAEDWDGRDPIR